MQCSYIIFSNLGTSRYSLPFLFKFYFSHPFPRGIPFLYIVPHNASEPSIHTSLGSNWDACPIRTLLKVVKSVVSCGTTVQVSFSHKCSQLNWCRALNVEVMATFSRYFLSSLLARLWCLPWCLVFWCRWPTKAFPRCIHSSSSSDDGSTCFPSSELSPHVKSRLAWSLCLPSSDLTYMSGLDWCRVGLYPSLD